MLYEKGLSSSVFSRKLARVHFPTDQHCLLGGGVSRSHVQIKGTDNYTLTRTILATVTCTGTSRNDDEDWRAQRQRSIPSRIALCRANMTYLHPGRYSAIPFLRLSSRARDDYQQIHPLAALFNPSFWYYLMQRTRSSEYPKTRALSLSFSPLSLFWFLYRSLFIAPWGTFFLVHFTTTW